MILVGARLCDRVHRAGGVKAVLSGKAAGFHLELLQCIRKWKRKIQVVVGIVVIGAVQTVRQAGLHAAGDLDDNRRVVSAAWIQRALRRGGRHSRQQDQLCNLPSIQRQFKNTGVVDHLTDARVACFHKRGIGLNLDALGNLSHFQQNIQYRVAANLQHDSCSHVATEPRQRRLQPIRTDREIRQRVRARLIGHRRARYPGIGLRDLHFHSRQNRTALIGHHSTDLRRRLRHDSRGQRDERHRHDNSD